MLFHSIVYYYYAFVSLYYIIFFKKNNTFLYDRIYLTAKMYKNTKKSIPIDGLKHKRVY